MFGELGLIFSLIPYIWKLIKNLKLKETLKKQISGALQELNTNYERFLDTIYKIQGACSVSIYHQPQIEPLKKAEELAIELKESYSELISSIKRLLRIMKTHKDEFKKVMKDKDWMVIEVMMECFGKQKVDIEYILNDKLINEITKKQLKKENKFIKKLNAEVKEFSKQEGIDIIPAKYAETFDTLRKFSIKIMTDRNALNKTLKYLERMSR